MRLLAALLLAASAGWAPLQCSSEPEFEQRRMETPAEALYGLAGKFKAEGREAAWRSTLEHLIARYPNSRFAVMARDDLEAGSGVATPPAPPVEDEDEPNGGDAGAAPAASAE